MEELKRLRKGRGLSQAKLAALADLDPSTVSQIETGARQANTRTLERLAGALGAEVADLFPKAQAPLPLDESAVWAPLLEEVLDAARQDVKRDQQALNRLGSSEGIPQTTIGYAEDEVRTKLRNLGYPDEFWEPVLWPMALRIVELEQQPEAKEGDPAERLGTDTAVRN
jgi:transcriptional regulator with XRE-family HTH domain